MNHIEAMKQALETEHREVDFIDHAPPSWDICHQRNWAQLQAAVLEIVRLKKVIRQAIEREEDFDDAMCDYPNDSFDWCCSYELAPIEEEGEKAPK